MHSFAYIFVFPNRFLTSSRKWIIVTFYILFSFMSPLKPSSVPVIHDALQKCVQLSSIGFWTLLFTRSFLSPGSLSNLHSLQTSINNSLITEHNSPQWVGHFNQLYPFFSCNVMGVPSTCSLNPHRTVPLFLSISHSPWSPQCASVLCHKHAFQVTSPGHWAGGCYDCLICIVCSLWNGSQRTPADQHHHARRCGQIPRVICLWVGNLLLLMYF